MYLMSMFPHDMKKNANHDMKKNNENLELNLQKAEQEKQTKDNLLKQIKLN